MTQLETCEGYCVFRPTGAVALEEATRIMVEAITQCRDQQVRRLLVDSRQLSIGTINQVDRYYFVDQWARAASGVVKVAMLVRATDLDPQQFARTVGANRGFSISAFAAEADAIAWLLDSHSD
ncbi:MAG TPA: hypothetical protein VE046_03570 [Steroidobacteraceae bacterium]|nr:hypothetical protein [Steroidobacteraceae bacterium]